MSSDRIQQLVDKTFTLSKEYRHHYVTIEHLLAIILDTEEIADIFAELGVDSKEVSRSIYDHLETQVEQYEETNKKEPKKTVMLERVFHRAFTQALFNGRGSLDTRDLLISILSETTTPATHFLNQRGINRDNVAMYLTDNETGQEIDTKRAQNKQERTLKKFCDNLNELAIKGEIDPVIGREEQLELLVQTVARRKKNNVILVGESGVGKTAIAEGLADLINEDRVPDIIKDHTVYSLDIGALLAGTKFRGDFEERLKEVLEILETKDKTCLLYTSPSPRD